MTESTSRVAEGWSSEQHDGESTKGYEEILEVKEFLKDVNYKYGRQWEERVMLEILLKL